MKHSILSKIYVGVGLGIAFSFGLMLSALYLNPVDQLGKIEPWMWVYFGIPPLFIIIFYANFIYNSKKAKEKGKKLDWKGWLLISLGYVAVMLTGFYMWLIEFITSLTGLYSNLPGNYESVRFYVRTGHSLVFIPALLAFGWLHGRRILFLTVSLILVYMYMHELGTFRITYCQYKNPMTASNQEMNLKITKEEKKFLYFFSGPMISQSMRDQAKCEMDFPLNPFIYNSDKTSMW